MAVDVVVFGQKFVCSRVSRAFLLFVPSPFSWADATSTSIPVFIKQGVMKITTLRVSWKIKHVCWFPWQSICILALGQDPVETVQIQDAKMSRVLSFAEIACSFIDPSRAEEASGTSNMKLLGLASQGFQLVVLCWVAWACTYCICLVLLCHCIGWLSVMTVGCCCRCFVCCLRTLIAPLLLCFLLMPLVAYCWCLLWFLMIAVDSFLLVTSWQFNTSWPLGMWAFRGAVTR